ncbi:MAG: PorP/SprF family type IX secretion system membrane protein [Bacteroidales bacterium]|jgi:type IX secretion system PorP/SprF family membrane protein|nr:PorP/SprF family type IX secretion system membrane protein [Bacteroidales bacterium]
MKRILIILTTILTGAAAYSQQSPLSESYFLDRYTLAPSYAGNFNSRYLFLGYRSDWTGIGGGPKTLRFSYNDLLPFMYNAGYGGKIVYDKAGIFSQLYVMGSYSYNLQVFDEHHVMFGLSMGLYHNTLNLLDYYNDPGYNIDPALVQQDINSKVKFMSDFSIVYTWKGLDAGVLFSNISFGDAAYKEVDLKYNPLSNFQFHASYLYPFAEGWDLSPLVIIRGGKYIKTQFEIASQVVWQKRLMASIVFRDPGVLGFGFGANIDKGIKVAYNFNFATNVEMGAFNNHEITLGINIFEYISERDVPMVK